MGSISGTFALVAFIAGLFCTRLKTAAIAGAAPALLYAALVVIGLWDKLADADLSYLAGWLMGTCLLIFLPAIIASYLRRGTATLLRRARGVPQD
jgi:hypothetical protein